MFLCRSTVSPSHVLSRSALRLFHRAADSAVSSRVVCRPRLDERPNFLSVQVSRRQFFSAASRDAGARFALRPPPRPAKRTKQPPPPEEEETMNYEVPMPEREPGSGLAKIFLAITIPIMLFSQADAIARFRVPPNEVREALNLDPNAKLSIAAYDYYIYHKKPDLVPWLEVAGFMKRNFSFVPANFVGNTPGEPARWWTLLTSEFNHGGLFHFFCCYTALKAFLPPLVQIYGSGVTAACFVVGGVMGHTFVGLYERTTNPFVKMSPAEIKKKAEAGFTKGEEKLHRDAYSWHLGSSSSLMTLGTICAIAYPTLMLRPMFIPAGIPIRVVIGAFVAFDLGGMIWGYGLPLGHSGHIGGAIAGLLLYRFWVRKLPTVAERYIQQVMREKGIKF